MTSGRIPQPTQLKLAKGNPGKRALNKKEPKPKRGYPFCPPYIQGEARDMWVRVSDALYQMGVLTTSDGEALARLCDVYGDLMEAKRLCKRDGFTYETTTTTGETLIKGNPAYAQMRAADTQFTKMLIEFGLTPASRSRIQELPEDEHGDKKKTGTDDFFG